MKQTIAAEELGSFFTRFGKTSTKAAVNIATILKKNPGRPLEIGLSISSAAASKSPEQAFSTVPFVLRICHTGKG